MRLNIKRLKQGDWDRYRETILSIELSAFPQEERTLISVFKDLINLHKPYTTIYYYGRKPVGYYMAAKLEDSGEDTKKYDKNFGKNNTIYLFSIGVHKHYQHCGIGRIMVKDLLKQVGKKYTRITFHTHNKKFRRLTYSMGFRQARYNFWEKTKMYYIVKRL